MAEDLTKVQLILCKEIKTEIQEVKNLLTTMPHEEIQRNLSNLAILLDERMTNLEDQYEELKKMVKQNSTQNYIANPALLEQWNPGDMVIRHSPWTTVRLVLNKVASENITELFPSDWHPRPMMSTDEEKQYKVITELMTHLFLQCGYLQGRKHYRTGQLSGLSKNFATPCLHGKCIYYPIDTLYDSNGLQVILQIKSLY